jgi:hypothetical protein
VAVDIYPVSVISGLKRFQDLDSDATPENNINVGALTIYQIIIDNTLNPSQKVYTKLYNSAAPTVGTTAPDIIIKTPGGISRTWWFLQGIAFATAVSFATVITPGTAGAGNPPANVTVTIWGA